MHIDYRNPRVRRGFAFVALAAVLGLAAVGLTQCRPVDDTVTGVDLQSNQGLHGRSSCVHICNTKYKQCLLVEEIRHKIAKKACGDNSACRKAEEKTHRDNKKACVTQKYQCKKRCYNEGAGNSGA